MASDNREVLIWLKQGNQMLSKSRFHNSEEAIKFAELLYHAGAKDVTVSGVFESLPGNGSKGNYADAIIVSMPHDLHSDLELLSIYRNEVKKNNCNDGKEFFGRLSDKLLFRWN